MTTGSEVLERAMQLLGYTDSYGKVSGEQDTAVFKRSASVVNQIFSELQRIEHPQEIDTYTLKMDETIPLLPQTVNDIMPYGVAMLIALSEGDGNKQAMFASIYNQKLKTVPKHALTRSDVLPMGEYTEEDDA